MTLVGDETRKTYDMKWDGATLVVDMPGYIPVLVSVALAGLLWTPGRFSLRTLLIATTLIALTLGVVVVAT